MCTASWLRRKDGYELFFNRDELHTRQPAHPPRLHELNGVRFLAPTDGDKGGTWLGVNEYGLTIGLLNRYQDSYNRAREYDSRGWLVRDLLASYDDAVAAERLANVDLTRFPPFTLLLLTPKQTRLAHWNGDKLWWEADADACMLLASSSYRAPEVIAARRAQFQEMTAKNELTPAFLRQFHHSQEPQAGPFAVCMHRDDAQTVSFSHVKLIDGGVEMNYHAGPPCSDAFVVSLGLQLVKKQPFANADWLTEYQYLWQENSPWALCQVNYARYLAKIPISCGGPGKSEIIAIRKLLDNYRDRPLAQVRQELAALRELQREFGGIEIHWFVEKAKRLGLPVEVTDISYQVYLPVDKTNGLTIQIEDNEIANQVVAKMLSAGCPIIGFMEVD